MNLRDKLFFKEHNLQYIDIVGYGGYSYVFLVYDTQYNQKFAIKTISVDKFNQNEVDCMIKLYDPNIVNLYRYYFYDDCVYLIMEYCPNTLEGVVKKNLINKNSNLLYYVTGVLKSINACHSKNIAHNDIKPSNFLIDNCGRIKAADFGFSGYHNKGEMSSLYVGSIPFMAPEVIKRIPHDPFKADVWSIGVTFYFIVTGNVPWNMETKEKLTDDILNAKIDLSCIEDREYARIIKKCLNRDPNKRPTIKEILEDDYIHSSDVSDQRSSSRPSFTRRKNFIIRPKIRMKTISSQLCLG